MKLECIGCGKSPDEIQEYIDMVEHEYGLYDSYDEYVIRNEGTLNVQTGKFACTECYVKMDMPLGVAVDEWKKLLE